MKKLILVILLILTVGMFPSYAKSNYVSVKAEFLEDVDINNSSNNQSLRLKLIQDSIFEKYIIPKDTIITAKLKNIKSSSSNYRRAKANLYFDEVVFPDGRIFFINVDAESNEFKESGFKNFKYGLSSAYKFPLLAGSQLIFLTAISPVLVFLDYSAIPCNFTDIVSESYAKGTEGANFKRKKGDIFEFKVKINPKNITEFGK